MLILYLRSHKLNNWKMGPQTEEHNFSTVEEQDNLMRNTEKVKMGSGASVQGWMSTKRLPKNQDGRRKTSYRDTMMGVCINTQIEGEYASDGEISDDDILEEDEGSWFSMGMFKEEKLEARKSWWMSVIIKLVGRSIGRQFLLRKLQAIWHIQNPFTLMNLSNDIFIIKFSWKQNLDTALFNGPWIIGDHYLHVQWWVPTFVADTSVINTLPVWICFPVLPLESYTIQWLERTGNEIGWTRKVDDTTLVASTGKFAGVCMDVYLTKPPKSKIQLRGKMRKIQYEGLHDLCFQCGKYGHRASNCTLMAEKIHMKDGAQSENNPTTSKAQGEGP